MTDKELTNAVKAIWKDACAKTAELVRAQGFKIFDDDYSFHRYVKHKDPHGVVTSGEDMLRLFVREAMRPGHKFVIATPENIAKEKDRCRRDAIKECRRQIESYKASIVENESFLAELLSDKKDIDYDK